MIQKLILPINKTKLTASWKTDAYRQRFGYVHYGADMVSAGDATLYASGDGKVVAVGLDSVAGNVVAVLYPEALNRATGQTQDVIFRYFHLASIAVKAGDSVTKDTVLGRYGNTGQLSTGAHLHLEADTDIEHPLYSPTVNSSSFLKGRALGANDKTMSNPLEWLHVKAIAPDNQTYITAGDDYIRPEDKNLPVWEDASSVLEIPGIDVSKHNGAIDWQKVKAAGKRFAFIRVGWAGYDGRIEANGGLDSLFHANMKGAIAAGLDVGIFVYSYCKTATAARTAAAEVLELVKPYKLTYPIAFDIEDKQYFAMSKAENSAIAKAFLTAIRDARCYPILYTYKNFAESYLDTSALSGWDVWIAQYANVCTYKGAYGVWQHHGDEQDNHPAGSCPGVTGACDLNTAYEDYAEIIREAGFNHLAEDPADDTAEQEIPALKAELAALRQDYAKLKEDHAIIKQDIAALAGRWPG